MVMRELNLSNIVEIKANKYGDVIKINASDHSTVDRFANLVKRIDELSADFSEKEKELNKKYAGRNISDENDIDIEQIVERSRLYTEAAESIINEFDAVFGEGCIHTVFREAYELNEDYVPDEFAFSDFLDAMIPIMTDIFHERFERNKNRYNAKRRGKHNKTKEELIEEYKEKSGACE